MDNGELTYNGWSNRETWLASLWLNNDESLYGLLMDAYRKRKAADEQAEWLENTLRYTLDEECIGSGFWSDVTRAAFNRICWVEIVEKNCG